MEMKKRNTHNPDDLLTIDTINTSLFSRRPWRLSKCMHGLSRWMESLTQPHIAVDQSKDEIKVHMLLYQISIRPKPEGRFAK